MKRFSDKPGWSTLLLVSALLTVSVSSARAQAGAVTAQQPQSTDPQQSVTQQDPIARLNLSAEQRQKIRAIREENKDERAAVNQRAREAQRAFNQALDSDNPSEELIAQRAHDLGEAQAAVIRMRAITEIRIRRVLTPEQVLRLREIRQEAARQRGEQNRQNNGNRRNGMPNSNGLRPFNQQRRALPRKPDQ